MVKEKRRRGTKMCSREEKTIRENMKKGKAEREEYDEEKICNEGKNMNKEEEARGENKYEEVRRCIMKERRIRKREMGEKESNKREGKITKGK